VAESKNGKKDEEKIKTIMTFLANLVYMHTVAYVDNTNIVFQLFKD
jgi:hypothetical protein